MAGAQAPSQPKDQEKKRELYSTAQRLLIGSLLAEGSHTSRVLELVKEDDFEEPRYLLIFSAITALSRRDEAVTHLSVAGYLENQGNLAKVGGPSEIFRLYMEGKNVYTADTSPMVYARIVKEASAKYNLKRLFTDIIPTLQDDSGVQAVDAVTNVQNSLNESLLRLSDTSTMSTFSQSFDEYRALLQERNAMTEAASQEGIQGIPCLLPTINKTTGGWKPGQLITVGAGTGIGKSVFAINCAVAAMMANASVMVFSLEMSREQLEDRIYASTTGIPMGALKAGQLTEEQTKVLEARMEEMKSMKLVIDVQTPLTVDEIRAKALRQAQSPEGLDFIIVDYLQLLSPSGKFSSRQEAVADISRNMKLLAKQLGIPIMVLVQMKRKDGDEESNALPTLDRIRESGAIAQDSDIVILLHREKGTDDTIPHTLVIVDKNRDGKSQVHVRCHSNLACSLFREVTRVKDVEERLNGEEDDSLLLLAGEEGVALQDDLTDDSFDLSDLDDILSDEDLGF